ncbi:MAG TPA: glycine cleavage T C-terminal barrel domain-containing protein, partial [Halanaerobiales bacterium]|nr:glycine cleavage T C-terminal barrel domain-containing protein [Halanaerobiales bacterium]
LLPAGLGARDTLRLEKAYCLYGNDIDENRHPLEAGLSWTVKLSKGRFIGSEALLRYKEEGYSDRLIGFKLIDRGIPRHGYELQIRGEKVGVVTSGSYSPTLNENIGLGYIKKDKIKSNKEIEVIIRGKRVRAKIVETPFI